MAADTLTLKNVGPIEEASVQFGDLTVFVGPQASGKSIFLQFLKLLLDAGPIFRSLRRYGLDWDRKLPEFFDLFFGEGMKAVWNQGSRLDWRGKPVDVADFVRKLKKPAAGEKSFFIPAQRVLALSRDGWLRPFADYKPGDPYTVRDFSEKLRVLMESGLGGRDAISIFPQERRLKSEIRRLLDEAIFSGFRLQVERHGPQKRLVLRGKGQEQALPFMVWSAGQREFVPLLLGFYWLLPPTKTPRRGSIEWAIIEEPEMGLHPKAIVLVLVMVMELLARGYRVCLSTHSPHVLDLVWGLRIFQEHHAEPRNILKLLEVRQSPQMLEVGAAVLKKTARVYYFDNETRTVRDISPLDPGSSQVGEARWGGLIDFSGRVGDAVAGLVARDADGV